MLLKNDDIKDMKCLEKKQKYLKIVSTVWSDIKKKFITQGGCPVHIFKML